MSKVQWVKITIDMFDNRKITHLRKLPDGNNIVLIWVMLLTMAGRCNANGMIFLTENIPYTPKMLADELDFEENTVKLALEALERFKMITTDENCFRITNWDEYQNVDGMERIREQNRLRKAKFDAKKRALPESNVTGNVTVTQSNATELEKEKDLKEKETPKGVSKKKSSRFSPPTVDEVKNYCLERQNGIDPEAFCDFYASKNWYVGKNKMSDWKAAVRTWERGERSRRGETPDEPPRKRVTGYHTEYDENGEEVTVFEYGE